MKKIKIMSLLFIMLGVSGCMWDDKKPDSIDYSAKIADMTKYVEEKYEEEFEFVEFRPADRGFNDDMNFSILSLRMKDSDIYTNIRELVGQPDVYTDDFINNYASYLMRDRIDYSNVINLNAGRLYLSSSRSDVDYNDLKNDTFEITNQDFTFLTSVISIEGEPTPEVIESLYDTYLSWIDLRNQLNIESLGFIVSFGGDLEKNKIYTNNYYAMNDYVWWEIYDPTITHELIVVESTLTYDEFCDELQESFVNGTQS